MSHDPKCPCGERATGRDFIWLLVEVLAIAGTVSIAMTQVQQSDWYAFALILCLLLFLVADALVNYSFVRRH